jgi:hypothetical protein
VPGPGSEFLSGPRRRGSRVQSRIAARFKEFNTNADCDGLRILYLGRVMTFGPPSLSHSAPRPPQKPTASSRLFIEKRLGSRSRAGPMKLVRSSLSIDCGLPCEKVGSAPAIVFSGPAQRSLALRPARSPSRHATLYTESSDRLVTSAAATIPVHVPRSPPNKDKQASNLDQQALRASAVCCLVSRI